MKIVKKKLLYGGLVLTAFMIGLFVDQIDGQLMITETEKDSKIYELERQSLDKDRVIFEQMVRV